MDSAAASQHPLLTVAILVGAATVALVAGMQTAVRVSTSGWFGAVASTGVCLAAVAVIARPVHARRASVIHDEARRWSSSTYEAFLMGLVYGAAATIVCLALFHHVGVLFAHGHWAASVLCAGLVAAAFYFEAHELNALRSLAWRGVKRVE